MRVGIGYDIHRLVSGRKLILGGVDIDHHLGLLGHSDADVLTHSIMDALLGSIGAGDIGTHFPDTDVSYKEASSYRLLECTADILKRNGFTVINIDCVVIAEAPKLAPHIDLMRRNIAGALGIFPGKVSVKATTNEGIGEIGRGKAIAAHAVALVEKMHCRS